MGLSTSTSYFHPCLYSTLHKYDNLLPLSVVCWIVFSGDRDPYISYIAEEKPRRDRVSLKEEANEIAKN